MKFAFFHILVKLIPHIWGVIFINDVTWPCRIIACCIFVFGTNQSRHIALVYHIRPGDTYLCQSINTQSTGRFRKISPMTSSSRHNNGESKSTITQHTCGKHCTLEGQAPECACVCKFLWALSRCAMLPSDWANKTYVWGKRCWRHNTFGVILHRNRSLEFWYFRAKARNINEC